MRRLAQQGLERAALEPAQRQLAQRLDVDGRLRPAGAANVIPRHEQAQRRNLQGCTIDGAATLVGFGPPATSRFSDD